MGRRECTRAERLISAMIRGSLPPMRSADTFVAAVRHHQAGQFTEADRLYRKVLSAEPRHVHALHLRGALAHTTGRNEEAVKLIGRAIALNDQVPDFHHNIGLALWALNR